MPRAIDARDFDRLRIGEGRAAADHVHVIALVEAAAQVNLAADHAFGFSHERAVIGLVAALVVGELLDRVAQRLARDRSAMGAGAADFRVLVDQRDPAAAFDSRHRGALSTGAAADDDHIVFFAHLTSFAVGPIIGYPAT